MGRTNRFYSVFFLTINMDLDLLEVYPMNYQLFWTCLTANAVTIAAVVLAAWLYGKFSR